MILETPRLQLIGYAPEHWLALIEGEAEYEASFGYRVAEGLRAFIASEDVSPPWLARLRDASGPDPWEHGFAVVDRESGLVIGSVGFKGPPDDQGMVEIAYGIAPAFEGRGFATEAASAGVAFAFGHDAVRVVRAHTRPSANASGRVLAKCGFDRTGHVVDSEDGLVWRYERHAEPRFGLRPATASDMTFLKGLRRGTMWVHFANAGLVRDEAYQNARAEYHLGCAAIVTLGDEDVGLLKVCRHANPWELEQIQIAPAHQRHGIGRRLLERLLAEARTANVSIMLGVLKGNPAIRLYQRAGFLIVAELDHAYRMRLEPGRLSGHARSRAAGQGLPRDNVRRHG